MIKFLKTLFTTIGCARHASMLVRQGKHEEAIQYMKNCC